MPLARRQVLLAQAGGKIGDSLEIAKYRISKLNVHPDAREPAGNHVR